MEFRIRSQQSSDFMTAAVCKFLLCLIGDSTDFTHKSLALSAGHRHFVVSVETVQDRPILNQVSHCCLRRFSSFCRPRFCQVTPRKTCDNQRTVSVATYLTGKVSHRRSPKLMLFSLLFSGFVGTGHFATDPHRFLPRNVSFVFTVRSVDIPLLSFEKLLQSVPVTAYVEMGGTKLVQSLLMFVGDQTREAAARVD